MCYLFVFTVQNIFISLLLSSLTWKFSQIYLLQIFNFILLLSGNILFMILNLFRFVCGLECGLSILINASYTLEDTVDPAVGDGGFYKHQSHRVG